VVNHRDEIISTVRLNQLLQPRFSTACLAARTPASSPMLAMARDMPWRYAMVLLYIVLLEKFKIAVS